MDKIDGLRIKNWMHRNARELDLEVWKCLFEGGETVAVANAMLAYQNEDGGVGHGIDPDNWNANSMPYACFYAIDTLRKVGFNDISHPIYQGIRKYLNATKPEQWMFTVSTNADYPHASFYNYDEQYNKVESIGVIMSLSAFVLEYAADLPVYDIVMQNLNVYITTFLEDELGDMGPSSYIELIEVMRRVGIQGYDYNKLEQRLIHVVNQTMQKDEEQWKGYGYRPSDFIKSNDSIFLKGNEELVQKECDYLIRTLPKDDVWPVSWCWFGNAEQYPTEEKIALHIAKARKCIERMQFLKEFDRVYF